MPVRSLSKQKTKHYVSISLDLSSHHPCLYVGCLSSMRHWVVSTTKWLYFQKWRLGNFGKILFYESWIHFPRWGTLGISSRLFFILNHAVDPLWSSYSSLTTRHYYLGNKVYSWIYKTSLPLLTEFESGDKSIKKRKKVGVKIEKLNEWVGFFSCM